MSTFDAAAHPRTSAGVTTGGQFTTKAKGESAVSLDSPAGGLPLPDGTEVAFRNPLPQGPKWLHGVVSKDAAPFGHLPVAVGDATPDQTVYVLEPDTQVLPFVEPAEYDGDDADTYADAFGWSSDDWGYYYDGRAEREQSGAYSNGLDDGRASVADAERAATLRLDQVKELLAGFQPFEYGEYDDGDAHASEAYEDARLAHAESAVTLLEKLSALLDG